MFSKHPRFQSPNPDTEAKIDALVAKMTLEEKIDMLSGTHDQKADDGNTVPCRRVGIRSFRMADASCGVHWWTDASTTFPAMIALAATFDTDLAYRYAEAVGRDCRAFGIHYLLGPGVNLYRSALCGRNFEYLGEDPWLASRMVVAYVKGLQDMGVCATVKHFAANFQEYDRHKVSSDVDERTLREVYLAAFEAAVKEGGAGAVMAAYNPVNGVHCTENDHLVREVLKGEWGFDGVLMSDWVATYDAVHAAAAGLDLEMPTARWMNREHLVPAVRDGRLSETVIDDKIRRMLRVAFAFGWMDGEQKQDEPGRNDKNAQVALDVAHESIVLLKNDGILPLDLSEYKRIAVIGTSSHPAVISGGGSAFNTPAHKVSILDGIKAAAKGAEIVHCKGADPWRDEHKFAHSAFFTEKGEPGVAVEYFGNADLAGQPSIVTVEPRIDNLWRDKPVAPGIGKKTFSIRYRAVLKVKKAGEHIFDVHCWDGAFRLLVDGNAVLDHWRDEVLGDRQGAMKLEAGDHLMVLEFHNVRSWNELRLGWEHEEMRFADMTEAVAAARSAELVLFCGGHTERSEGEGFDRTFGMHPVLEKFLDDVLAVNANTVVVLTAGGNVDMSAWHDRARAIVMAWYPGQEGGTAVADVLTGRVNPSGRLPATFEARLEDRSSFDCYQDSDGDLRVALNDGVFGGYRHHDRTGTAPRYAFGFGLSYTAFEYENVALSAAQVPKDGTVIVSFDVVNTGKVKGKDAPQVYVGDLEARVARPKKELRGFAKVELAPGERTRVSVPVEVKALAFWDMDEDAWVVEPGDFAVYVGASAADIRLEARFRVG
jgi:beta-glucosidase